MKKIEMKKLQKMEIPHRSLHVAVENNDIALAIELISGGTDVNATNEIGWTALNFAAREGNIDIGRALIKANASVNLADRDGWTPMHICSMGGHPQFVKVFCSFSFFFFFF